MNQNKVKLSIVVPVYNVANYLSACLDSIINQTFVDFEVLLINDGSKDNSGSICDEYAKLDARVKVFHKKNEGVSVARNLALAKAQGEYITFIDADDWLDLNTYTEVFEVFKETNVDCVSFGFQRSDGSGPVYVPPVPELLERDQILHSFIPNYIGNKNDKMRGWVRMATVWSLVVKRSYTQGILFENVKIAEDKLFFLELMIKLNSLYLLDKPYYYYRVNPNSALRIFQPNAFAYLSLVQTRVRELLESAQLFEENRERFENASLRILNMESANHAKSSDSLIESSRSMKTFVKEQNIADILSLQKTLSLMKKNPLWILLKLRLYLLYLLIVKTLKK